MSYEILAIYNLAKYYLDNYENNTTLGISSRVSIIHLKITDKPLTLHAYILTWVMNHSNH